MTDVRCRECNELNDRNAFKCESCKTNLSDANYSEVDDCENDYRFIEEAEMSGEVYKLENVDDGNFPLEDIPIFYSPKNDFKIEKESNLSESTAENFRIPNGTDVNIKGTPSTEPEDLPKSAYVDRNETIWGVSYQCEKCSKSFKRYATLKTHMNKDHVEDEKNIRFENIASENKSKPESSFGSGSDLSSESYDSEYVPSAEDSPSRARTKRTKLPLKVKGKLKRYSTESDSENNTSRKKADVKYKARSSSSQILLDSKQNKPLLKPHMVYKCTACEKITKNYKEHVKHIVIHEAPPDSLTETTSLEKLKKTPSGFLKCRVCEIVFMSQRDFKIHEKLHQGEKVFQCDICQAFLVNQASLQKHKTRLHKKRPSKKDKQFECIICNEKFSAQILMIHHRKTHTDVIKKMEEMTIIERHDGKTIYVCKLCAKTSKNKYRHEEHLRVHTKEKPYKCERCGTRISTANALAHHLRLHDDDRPFKCDICTATYRHKKSLQKHLRRHTGEKPFKCHYCVKTFAFNYTRADHERNCHIGEFKSRKRWKHPTEAGAEIEADRTIETEVPKNETAKVGTIETRRSKKPDVV